MAKLETQINQIYLISPGTKKRSLVLYEEEIEENHHVFVIVELADSPKTASGDLKKISETIIETFKTNRKLKASSLFESSLAEINQELANLYKDGRKSWLGKLSSIILLKSNDSIFVANSGAASAFLKRSMQVSKILDAEKKGLHPLKTFTNFISGKIKENDGLVITTSNIFNFISNQLFTQTLSQENVEQASHKISQILQESKSQDDAFASFFLQFTTTQTVLQGQDEFVYAPSLEEMETVQRTGLKIAWPALLVFSNFRKLSAARKFFLLSFLAFLGLFLLNLAVFGAKGIQNKNEQKITAQLEIFSQKINEVESALIYKNETKATQYLKEAQQEFDKLKSLSKTKAVVAETELKAAYNLVDKVTVVENPRIFAELKYSPIFLSKAGNGFLIAGSDAKTVSIFENGSLNNLFFLNAAKGGIRGVAHAQGFGNIVLGKDSLYRINQAQSQFDTIKTVASSEFFNLRFLAPNRVYALEKSKNQVYRFTFGQKGLSDPTALLKTASDLSNAQDFGAGGDVYILFPDHVKKFVAGRELELKFALSDPLTAANRIFVASSIYVLESSKKRLLIFNKTGGLQNQIYFPSMKDMKDLYVDENQRSIYLLDENKLVEITF